MKEKRKKKSSLRQVCDDPPELADSSGVRTVTALCHCEEMTWFFQATLRRFHRCFRTPWQYLYSLYGNILWPGTEAALVLRTTSTTWLSLGREELNREDGGLGRDNSLVIPVPAEMTFWVTVLLPDVILRFRFWNLQLPASGPSSPLCLFSSITLSADAASSPIAQSLFRSS